MTEVIVPLLSAFLGGGVVAILNHYLENQATRSKIELNKATIDNLQAQTVATRVQTERHKAELSKLETQQGSLALEIDDLELLFTTVLTEWEREHLRKLNSPGGKFPYRWSEGFKQELSRLLALNLADRRPGRGIRSAMADGRVDNNLLDHFSITEKGKHYLARLDEIDERLRDIEM
jgi:hypothetical protein